MATPAQIEAQVTLERECIRCGIDKLHKDTNKAEQREYASASIYGQASIAASQEAIAEAIQSTFDYKVTRGKSGVAFAQVHQYLNQFNDPKQAHILANIALKRTFDTVFSRKRKDAKSSPNTVSNVCVNIGAAVEAECQMRWYESQNGGLYNSIKTKLSKFKK